MEAKTNKVVADMQGDLASLVEFVKLLSAEQEKLTERLLTQSSSQAGLPELGREVKELRELVMQSRD